jgi:predicted dehydrogenase
MTEKKEISRRRFIGTAAATGVAVTIVPRHVLGRGFTPPSDLFNVACVGVGGMGRSNLINLASQNVVALCDVDWGYTDKNLSRLDTDVANLQAHIDHPDATAPGAKPSADTNPVKAKERLANILHLKNDLIPKAKRYSDYRKMLEQKDIDGVVIATPDHMHAPIALASMDLGKHVFVQKPLTWSIAEARQLAKRAKETKLATQMGNQGHSMDDARTAVEYVWAGAIGEVREIHVWTDRPVGYWPQGIPRPKAPVEPLDTLKWDKAGVDARLAAAMAAGNYPIPETLSWDLFLGVGPEVPYHPVYHPFNWRGWIDWGCGAIGDMGAHLLDVSMWSLNLGLPTSVETVTSPFNGVCFPTATMTFYEFPARGSMPAVKLTWYDGGLMPRRPEELGEEPLKAEGGALLIGSKGKLMHNTYGRNPRLLPASLQASVGKPPEKLARIDKEDHEMNWVDAGKGTTTASCPFEYAAQLTEVMLLGVVSLRSGKKLLYDGANMKVTNVPEANQYLSRQYRTGW